MSNPQGKTDPLEQWRELRDTYMDIWAKASGEAVNSDAYAQASGAMLEAFLTTSSPYREAQKKAMVSALEQCNMPSRDDYVRMADRLGNIELLLDDMDAKLRQVYQLVSKAGSHQATVTQLSAVPRPPAPEHEPEPELFSAPETHAAPKPAAAPEPAELAAPSGRATVPQPAATAPQRSPKNGHATKSKPRGTKPTKKGV